MFTETLQGFELSPQQKLIWSLAQRDGAAGYRSRCAVTVSGDLDPGILAKALWSVVERNELLRTKFRLLAGMPKPLQIISPKVRFDYVWQDLSILPVAEKEARRRELLEGAVRDEAEGEAPVLYVTHLTFEPGQHLLALELSAMHADAASILLLARQVRETYLCCRDGHTAPDLHVQYADISETLNECLESEEFDLGRQFWRGRVANTLAHLTTSFETAPDTFRPRHVDVPVTDALARMAQEFCARYGVSREAMMLACWGLLRCRVEATEEVLIGLCCDGRTHDMLRETVGVLSRHVPFSFQWQRGSSFQEITRTVEALQAEIMEEQHYFDPAAFSEIEAATGYKYGACFEYVRLKAEHTTEDYSTEELAFAMESLFSVSDRFLSKLTVIEDRRVLRLQLEYDASAVSESEALQLGEEFTSLLESALRNPERRAELLKILSPGARLEVLAISRGPESRLDVECVNEMFERQARQRPDAVAVAAEGQQLSYEELDRRANRLARYLQRLGVSSESVVGLYMERSLEMVIGLLGVLKAGGAYLPLDPNYPAERLAFMLGEAQPPVLLTQEWLAARLPECRAQVICLDADWGQVAQESGANLSAVATPGHLAYVIYTSGSTGRPKGVMISHRAVCNHMIWMQRAFRLSSQDSMLQKTPFGFDAAATEFYLPLMAGGKLVMARHEGHRDPAYLASAIYEEGVTILQLVPSMLRELLASNKTLIARGPLRRVFCGGEQLTPELASSFIRSGTVELCNLYGPTEATIDGSYWEVPREGALETVPIGGPIANSQVYVLDREMELVPTGVSGEIYIGGEAVGRGYFEQPDLTSEKYVPNPHEGSGGRLYRTGDLGRLSRAGEVEYLGRIDQQVKLRGYRIELGEIETVLRRHESVGQCAVMVREETPGDQRLVAYVVPASEAVASDAELKGYLAGKLPEYMVPSVFIELRELPLMPNGKLDRKALPAPQAAAATEESERLLTPVEEIVAGVFAEVLKLEQVGINQNFFEMGGHSLLATQVVSRIRELLGLEVPLRSLFEAPTAATMAQVVERQHRSGIGLEAPAILPVSRDRQLPLSFAQQRLWFIQQLEPDSVAYNTPLSVKLRGAMSISALKQSLEEIARRHEVLRTRFEVSEGRPVQVIEEAGEIELSVWDISELEEEEREKVAREVVGEEAGRAFDLERGPVWKAVVVRVGEEEHVLVVSMHHVASDGWSVGVMVKEFGELYERYEGGEKSRLEELEVQYVDFAVWQREWLQGQVLDEQLDYWRRRLAGVQALELPTDRPRSTATSHREGNSPFRVSAELTQQLKALSRREGVTLFMTLLAGFKLVLGRYSGQQDVVVGTDVANRNRLETENLIGFFVNQLVLRTNLSGNQSLRELLRQVRETTLGAYQHQDLPFEKLVEELSPERNQNRSPLFQVKFVLQNAPMQPGNIQLPDIKWFPVGIPVAKFDMLFNLIETGDGLVGEFSFCSDLFTQGSVNWLLGMYEAVLKQLGQPESLDQSIETLMAAIEAPLKSENQEEQYHLFSSGSRPNRRRMTLLNQVS